MSGKGTIVVTEHGATVTVCINRAFAERLIDYINSIPEKQKPEGDNQVLAGMIDQVLSKATAPPKPRGPRKKPRWLMRYLVRTLPSRRDPAPYCAGLSTERGYLQAFWSRTPVTVDEETAELLRERIGDLVEIERIG